MGSDLKSRMCRELLESGAVKPYDVIRHSYTKSRMAKEFKDIRENNVCPTLDTRCDCLGVVIDETTEPRKKEEKDMWTKLAAEAAITMLERGELRDCLVVDFSYSNARIKGEQGGTKNANDTGLFPTVTTNAENYGICLEGEKNMKKDNCKMVGELDGKFQKMTESSRRVDDPEYLAPTLHTCGGGNLEPKIIDDKPEVIAGVGEKKSNNGTQFYEQDRIYNSEKVATAIPAEKSFHPYYNQELRIRKLTPCECLRLMAFTKEDYGKLKDAGQTDSQIYHESGDSIVVSVLIGLFGQMTDADVEKVQRQWAEKCAEGQR